MSEVRKPVEAVETVAEPVADKRLDRWLMAAAAITLTAYGWLIPLHPDGENWGRGWNLVAFWIYSTPLVVGAGGVGLWRVLRAGRPGAIGGTLLVLAAFAYPFVALVIIKAKA